MMNIAKMQAEILASDVIPLDDCRADQTVAEALAETPSFVGPPVLLISRELSLCIKNELGTSANPPSGLIFGRFLGNTPIGAIPGKLTEGAFRDRWSET